MHTDQVDLGRQPPLDRLGGRDEVQHPSANLRRLAPALLTRQQGSLALALDVHGAGAWVLSAERRAVRNTIRQGHRCGKWADIAVTVGLQQFGRVEHQADRLRAQLPPAALRVFRRRQATAEQLRLRLRSGHFLRGQRVTRFRLL